MNNNQLTLDFNKVNELINLDRELTYLDNNLFAIRARGTSKVPPSIYSEIYVLLDKLKTSPYSKLYNSVIASLEKITNGLEKVLGENELDTHLETTSREIENSSKFEDDIPF